MILDIRQLINIDAVAVAIRTSIGNAARPVDVGARQTGELSGDRAEIDDSDGQGAGRWPVAFSFSAAFRPLGGAPRTRLAAALASHLGVNLLLEGQYGE